MSDAHSFSRTDLLQAVVAVCAFGGVFMFIWAAGAGAAGPAYGPAFGRRLGLAIALWIVGGTLSFGIDDGTDPDDKTGRDADIGEETLTKVARDDTGRRSFHFCR